jgi:hypothetical protein
MTEVHKGDPNAARTALTIVVGGTLVGALLIWALSGRQSQLEIWVEQNRSTRLPMAIGAVALLSVGPVLGFAVYFWSLGQRVIHAQRYPPPGLRVVHDTPVVVGDLAVRRGQWIRTLAALVGMAGLLLGVMFWRFALMASETGSGP